MAEEDRKAMVSPCAQEDKGKGFLMEWSDKKVHWSSTFHQSPGRPLDPI